MIEDSIQTSSPMKEPHPIAIRDGRFSPQSLLNRFRYANRIVRNNKTSSLLYRNKHNLPLPQRCNDNTVP